MIAFLKHFTQRMLLLRIDIVVSVSYYHISCTVAFVLLCCPWSWTPMLHFEHLQDCIINLLLETMPQKSFIYQSSILYGNLLSNSWIWWDMKRAYNFMQILQGISSFTCSMVDISSYFHNLDIIPDLWLHYCAGHLFIYILCRVFFFFPL